MAAHGVPRGTQDLDNWIDPATANAERVWRALAAFGAPLADLHITPADFTRPETVVQVGLPPARIDVLTGITGLSDFQEAWATRAVIAVRALHHLPRSHTARALAVLTRGAGPADPRPRHVDPISRRPAGTPELKRLVRTHLRWLNRQTEDKDDGRRRVRSPSSSPSPTRVLRYPLTTTSTAGT
jgi:hypothetical protein